MQQPVYFVTVVNCIKLSLKQLYKSSDFLPNFTSNIKSRPLVLFLDKTKALTKSCYDEQEL